MRVETGDKAGETTDGKESVTTCKSENPIAAAGFAFGDYKVVTDKVSEVEIQVYANNQPDDLLKRIQRHFDDPLSDLAPGPGGAHPSTQGAVGILRASALAKTFNMEAENSLKD